MDSPFERDLARALDMVYPDAFDRLGQLDTLPEDIAEEIMKVLLDRACQSQHVGTIGATCRAMRRVPPRYRHSLLPVVIDRSLDLEDEWEFRRVIELLRELEPSLVAHYVAKGMASLNPGVRDAARDFHPD